MYVVLRILGSERGLCNEEKSVLELIYRVKSVNVLHSETYTYKMTFAIDNTVILARVGTGKREIVFHKCDITLYQYGKMFFLQHSRKNITLPHVVRLLV